MPRRGAIAFVTTALGLVLLLSFKTPPSTVAGTAGGSTVAVGQPSATAAAPTAPTAPTAPSNATAGATQAPATAAPAAGLKNGTYTGQTEQNRYGSVQVQVTIAGGRITAVQALRLPSDRQLSAEISQQAGPMLQSEALQAQSAQIDILSGATYTSMGYAQSLQSALDQARG